MAWIVLISSIIMAYLLGSLSSAIVLCRLAGLPDPRTEGSGNPGATNVLRIAGKKLAAMVFLGDFIKGALPVLLASFFVLPAQLVWVGLFAVLGHLYPLYFQFKGGKGVATAAGVLIALSWKLGILVMITWVLVVGIFRFSSLGAIVASIGMPIYAFWLFRPIELIPLFLMSILILIRHRENMRRLLAGDEHKIGRSS